MWCATGNNITVGGDIPRRCYRIRLDALVANPYLRPAQQFKHPALLAWLEEERSRLLGALLTVCRAWFDRGKPDDGAPTMGSFEEWARVVWGVLSLDIPTRVEPAGEDSRCYGEFFLANGAEVWEEGDTDAEEWLPFLQRLHDNFTRLFTVSEVVQAVQGDRADAQLKSLLPSGLGANANKDSFPKLLGQAFKRKKADATAMICFILSV